MSAGLYRVRLADGNYRGVTGAESVPAVFDKATARKVAAGHAGAVLEPYCDGCNDPVNHPHTFDCPALAAEHEHPTLEALLECEAAECVELLTPGRRVVLAGKICPLFGGERGESLAEVHALAADGSVKRSRIWSPLALRRRALTEALAAHKTLTTL